jgi:SAM-dependent methyltransferase
MPDANGRATGEASWEPIVRHYESCLAQHGTSPKGVDWPNANDLAARFGIMLELIEGIERPALLDVGCGPGLLVDYLTATDAIDRVDYEGIDLSEAMIAAARTRWPGQRFACRDIIKQPLAEQSVDIVIMNGVLTERISLTVEAMTSLAQALVLAAFRCARIGIAFNVMSAHVDWQRDDLFHWPYDDLAAFLKREVSRHYSLRADYGLYEYTCFVRREPRRADAPTDEAWWVG